jgi:hypothetical protein
VLIQRSRLDKAAFENRFEFAPNLLINDGRVRFHRQPAVGTRPSRRVSVSLKCENRVGIEVLESAAMPSGLDVLDHVWSRHGTRHEAAHWQCG